MQRNETEIFSQPSNIGVTSRMTESIKGAQSGRARWMDQKVTFDNLHAIAVAVDFMIPDDSEFTRFTIQGSKVLGDVIRREYGKPSLENEESKNEYDKFIAQPLNALSYAGVLSSERRGTRYYRVRDREMLQYIAAGDRNAREFLITYIQTVLSLWGWWGRVETYFNSPQTNDDLRGLKTQFYYLMVAKTGLGSRKSSNPTVESSRIFTKVLNPLAFAYGAHGTERGRVMKTIPSRLDLVYNRPNFLDVAAKKPKDLTRKQFESILAEKAVKFPAQTNQSAVMRSVRTYHRDVPEVPSAVGGKARHVHHIFPKSSHAELADTPENLIALTSAQHLFEAHPEGNTQKVDPIFQRNALLYKLESIEKSRIADDGMYDYARFADVLFRGYGIRVESPDYHACHKAIISRLG